VPDGEASIILIADDEPLVLGVVASSLELAGYTVRTATSGAEALEICRRDNRRIDLALLDYYMPGMSGTDLYHRLREFYPGVKVIIMSGYTEQLFRKFGDDSDVIGVDGVLAKPFLPSQVVSKVKSILESR